MNTTQTPGPLTLTEAAYAATLIDVTTVHGHDLQAEASAATAAEFASWAREAYAKTLSPSQLTALNAEYARQGRAGVVDTEAQAHWATCTPVGGRKS